MPLTDTATERDAGHLVLLGDSVLDNGAYVPGEPDVVAQVGALLPAAWSATLLAVDGDVVPGVARQLRGLPRTATGLPTAVCTIYDTRLEEPGSAVIRGGLAMFNDVITRAAFSRGLTVLDLRLVCDEDEDYANPIEPSARGGAKIAAVIAAWVSGGATARRAQVVW